MNTETNLDCLPLLTEPEALAQRLAEPELLIVDLSQDQTWQRAHLPNAVHLPPAALMHAVPPAAGLAPALPELQETFRQIGLKEQQPVIAYDDEGGGWAGRLLWTLDLIGHSNASVLNGGLAAWLQAGLPLTTEVRTIQPSQLVLPQQPVAGVSADRNYIEARLGQDDFVIWDARSPEEFSGQRPNARRGGHIPGARNYEWTRAMDRERGLRLRPLAQIRAELEVLDIHAGVEVVTHCQSHHRSGFTYFLGKLLQFPRLRAYPGSWSEWGNLADTPIET